MNLYHKIDEWSYVCSWYVHVHDDVMIVNENVCTTKQNIESFFAYGTNSVFHSFIELLYSSNAFMNYIKKMHKTHSIYLFLMKIKRRQQKCITLTFSHAHAHTRSRVYYTEVHRHVEKENRSMNIPWEFSVE